MGRLDFDCLLLAVHFVDHFDLLIELCVGCFDLQLLVAYADGFDFVGFDESYPPVFVLSFVCYLKPFS